MIFHLDEHVTERLTELAENAGFDVVSLDRLGLKGIDDAASLLLAARSNRILVTYDARDYTLLHRAWLLWSSAWVAGDPPAHAGIAALHSSKGTTLDDLVAALAALSRLVDSPESRLFS